MTATEPRIYVACLAAYNNGKLHGRWIDATLGADHIQDEINAMLAESPEPGAEEWAVHDYDGMPSMGEHPNLEAVAKYAECYEKHGEAWKVWVDNDPNHNTEESDFEEQYLGEFDSLEDYAANFLERTGGLEGAPDLLKTYFDFAAYGRDMELGGDIWTHEKNGRLFVFRND